LRSVGLSIFYTAGALRTRRAQRIAGIVVGLDQHAAVVAPGVGITNVVDDRVQLLVAFFLVVSDIRSAANVFAHRSFDPLDIFSVRSLLQRRSAVDVELAQAMPRFSSVAFTQRFQPAPSPSGRHVLPLKLKFLRRKPWSAAERTRGSPSNADRFPVASGRVELLFTCLKKSGCRR